MGVFLFAFGLWGMVRPESFFAAAAAFEPHNEHFVMDIGAFQIGLGAVLSLGTGEQETPSRWLCWA